ncbi:hypothetical protein [Dokdonella ginsengisoli]|uniref:Phage holin family protein n=1 Tax=Dokdonella ginsengisoli TaxID=363846 RepID=A0ABV9QSA5_9GAMM
MEDDAEVSVKAIDAVLRGARVLMLGAGSGALLALSLCVLFELPLILRPQQAAFWILAASVAAMTVAMWLCVRSADRWLEAMVDALRGRSSRR